MIIKDAVFGLLIGAIPILMKVIDYYFCRINKANILDNNEGKINLSSDDCKSSPNNMSVGLLPLPLFYFDNLSGRAEYFNKIRNILICIIWMDLLIIIILNILKIE
jgi:hypothetical protein